MNKNIFLLFAVVAVGSFDILARPGCNGLSKAEQKQARRIACKKAELDSRTPEFKATSGTVMPKGLAVFLIASLASSGLVSGVSGDIQLTCPCYSAKDCVSAKCPNMDVCGGTTHQYYTFYCYPLGEAGSKCWCHYNPPYRSLHNATMRGNETRQEK